jgi:hypothetical protein
MAELPNATYKIELSDEMRAAMAQQSATETMLLAKLEERKNIDARQMKRIIFGTALSLIVIALDVVIIVLLVKR